jgi:hypothetical protein
LFTIPELPARSQTVEPKDGEKDNKDQCAQRFRVEAQIALWVSFDQLGDKRLVRYLF